MESLMKSKVTSIYNYNVQVLFPPSLPRLHTSHLASLVIHTHCHRNSAPEPCCLGDTNNQLIKISIATCNMHQYLFLQRLCAGSCSWCCSYTASCGRGCHRRCVVSHYQHFIAFCFSFSPSSKDIILAYVQM